MIKAQIVEIREDRYMVEDENGTVHMAKMWFENFSSTTQSGDYMFITESVITDLEERITPKTYGHSQHSAS